MTPTDCTGVVITDTVHAATRPRRHDATTTSSTFFRRHSSPHLWNQLPSSFRQPHLVHYPSSPHPAHITSSQLSPSFSPSVTPSTTPDLKLISFTNPFLHSHSRACRLIIRNCLIRENDHPGNERLSGKVTIRESSLRETSYPGK